MQTSSLISALAVTIAAPQAAAAVRPVHRLELPGGAKAIVVEDHSLEQIHVGVTLRVGSLADPPGKEGLARITAEMLLRGAQGRTRDQIDEAVDSLGSSLAVDAGHTSLSLDGDALTRNFDAFIGLLADVLLRPTFPEDELRRVVQETVSEIESERDDDQALASRFFRRYLFHGHPYGRPPIGTVASVRGLTLADVKAFYETHFVGGNLIFSAAGDITAARFRASFLAHLSAVRPGAATTPRAPAAPRPEGRRVVLVDKPDRTQTQILVGHDGIPAHHPDAAALAVVNTAFGGTFTARLMQEIRVKNGWSYGAYSRLGSDRDAGSFYMWIFPSTKDAIAATARTLELYEKLVDDGLTDAELEFSREYLTGTFAFEIDTAKMLADELVRVEILGLPADHLDTWASRVRAVTAADARRVITEHMHPQDMLLTILCTAEDLRASAQTLKGVTSSATVVAYDSD